MARTKKAKKTKPNGRPSKYKDDYARQALVACKTFGSTEEQLAKLFDVTVETIGNWKKQHEEFFQALKDGKDKFDSKRVESSLLKRALGYEYEEVHEESIIIFKDGEEQRLVEKEDIEGYGDNGKTRKVKKLVPGVKRKIVTKQVIPDVLAQKYWLNNRHHKRWRDVKAIELTGKDGGPVQKATTEMSEQDAYAMYLEKIKGDANGS